MIVRSYDLRTGLKTKTNAISWNPMEAFNFTTHSKNERSMEDHVSTIPDVYHTKRMQRIFCVKYSVDSKVVLSSSDDGNVKLWKAKASKKLGAKSYRSRAYLEYSEQFKARYKDLPRSDVLQDSSDEGSETASADQGYAVTQYTLGVCYEEVVNAVTAYEKSPIKDIPLNIKTPSYTQRDQVYAAELCLAHKNEKRKTFKRGNSTASSGTQEKITGVAK
ncbi:1424_t:CDS:2 [Paraglomus brasilianum]|uniref:1424_t:CDS:1 n=1 Tax=Paraglomus brasilianum TaxID=144538 RepID=A0A9N9GYP8_9GLOM|nr:1424_t:CDS:2 [Paraglomus brasilianum]